MKGFEQIAPYLSHPLVLIGFALSLLFGTYKQLIKSGIIPSVSSRTGGRLVQLFLQHGFLLIGLIILLGFGLQYYKASLDKQTKDAMQPMPTSKEKQEKP